MKVVIIAAVILLCILRLEAKHSPAKYMYPTERALVVCHRGDSATFPELSRGAYSSCYFENADFIELDIQITKDFQVIVQHDQGLHSTTNIAEFPIFEDRKTMNGGKDWSTNDFTVGELKLLRRKQRYGMTRNPFLDSFDSILTL